MADDNQKKDNNSSWSEYKLYVLEVIKKFSKQIEELQKDSNEIKIDIVEKIYDLKMEKDKDIEKLRNVLTILQTRSAIWNSLIAIIVSSIIAGMIKILFE